VSENPKNHLRTQSWGLNKKEPVTSGKKEKVNKTVTCNAHSESSFIRRQVSTKVSRNFSERDISWPFANAFIRLWRTSQNSTSL